jgi:endonuclease G
MPDQKFSDESPELRKELELLRSLAGLKAQPVQPKQLSSLGEVELAEAVEEVAIATDDIAVEQNPLLDVFNERQIGTLDLVDVAYLERGAAVARAVCKLHGKDELGYFTGTAFLVAERLLVTNHHNLPTEAIAAATYVEFEYERGQDGLPRDSERFVLKPEDGYWSDKELDVCVVAVAALSQGGVPINRYSPVRLNSATGKIDVGQFITLVHHPDGEWKQVALRENRLLKKDEKVLWYSSDTSPGSSGAPCFSDQWEVVAVHRRGVPQTKPDDENMIALRNGEFATRSQIKNLKISDRDILWLANEGVRVSVFLDAIGNDPIAESNLLIAAWLKQLGPQRFAAHTTQITVVSEPAAFEENRRPQNDYEKRNGYQPDFLGISVAPPNLDGAIERWGAAAFNSDTGDIELPYYNFSVWMSRERRMPFLGAVNIDGANHNQRRRDEFGNDKWVYDDRLPERLQIGEWFYGNEPARYRKNYFDRGHIVRRTEPTWGSEDLARLANDDTYHWTNCTPQYKDFNQRSRYWQGLEKYLLEKGALKHKKRLTLFTGPIFADDDTEHRSVLVPKRFFKVAVFVDDADKLQSAAYVLDQSQWVDVIDFERAPALDVLAARRSIGWLEEQTGLDFGEVVRGADGAAGLGDDPMALAKLGDLFG